MLPRGLTNQQLEKDPALALLGWRLLAHSFARILAQLSGFRKAKNPA